MPPSPPSLHPLKPPFQPVSTNSCNSEIRFSKFPASCITEKHTPTFQLGHFGGISAAHSSRWPPPPHMRLKAAFQHCLSATSSDFSIVSQQGSVVETHRCNFFR